MDLPIEKKARLQHKNSQTCWILRYTFPSYFNSTSDRFNKSQTDCWMTAREVQHHRVGIKLWHWAICNGKSLRLCRFLLNLQPKFLFIRATGKLIWPYSPGANLIGYYNLCWLVKWFLVDLFLFLSFADAQTTIGTWAGRLLLSIPSA